MNVDWQHYIDEDEEDEVANAVPNYGNEHSFPGFGGDDDLPEEDEEPIAADNKSKKSLN